MIVRRALALCTGVAVLAACGGRAEPEPAPEPAPVEEPAPEPEPEPEPEPAGFAPLTGVALDEDEVAALADRPLLVVKVDNGPAARPQTGLEVADVVVEEPVEGGVTRFMVLFHSQLPDLVGPVRSARPVDVEYASGFPTPVFAYSGARGQVQAQLRAAPVVALEEGAPGFQRTRDRRAPNNLYVRPADTLAAGVSRGAEPLADAGLTFDVEPPAGERGCPEDEPGCTPPGQGLEVAMSNAFRTGWTYDADANRYRRQQNGSDFTVTGPDRIGAANVVVLAARHYSSGCCDSAGSPYRDVDLTGSGQATVLRDGRRYDATWEKPGATGVLRVLDADGQDLPLAPGPTWILLPAEDRFPR